MTHMYIIVLGKLAEANLKTELALPITNLNESYCRRHISRHYGNLSNFPFFMTYLY